MQTVTLRNTWGVYKKIHILGRNKRLGGTCRYCGIWMTNVPKLRVIFADFNTWTGRTTGNV